MTLHFEPCSFGNIYDTKRPILIFSLYVDAQGGAPFATWFRDFNVKARDFNVKAQAKVTPKNYRINRVSNAPPSLRGALATKQPRGRVMRPLGCFASLAMTGWKLARLFLGVA